MTGTFLLTLLGTDTKYANKTEGSKVRVETLSFMHDAAIGEDITNNVIEHKYSQISRNGATAAGVNGSLTKAIIDGPSTTGGNVYEKIGEATLAILDQIAQGQTTINIQAHSRGACEAIIVAHEIQRLIDLAEQKKAGEQLTSEDVSKSDNSTTQQYLSTGNNKPAWIQKILNNEKLVENLEQTKINIFNIDPVPGDSQSLSYLHAITMPVGTIVGAATGLFKWITGRYRVLPESLGKFSIENFPWDDQRFFKLPSCVKNYSQAIPEYEESAFFNSVLPTAESTDTTVRKIIFGGNHATASGCMGYQTKEKDKPVKVKIKTPIKSETGDITYKEEEKEFDTSTAQELIACKIADFHVSSARVVYDFQLESCKEKEKQSYPEAWRNFEIKSLKEILPSFVEMSESDKKEKYLAMYEKIAENYLGYQALADGHYAYKDGRAAHMTKMGRMLRTASGETILERNLDYRIGENGQILFVSQEHAELYIESLIGGTTITLEDEVKVELGKIETKNPGITEAFILLHKFITPIKSLAADHNDKLATAITNPTVRENIKRALEVGLEKLASSAEFNASSTLVSYLLSKLPGSLSNNGECKQETESTELSAIEVITHDGRNVNENKKVAQEICNELRQKLESLRSDYFKNLILSIKSTISTNGYNYLRGNGVKDYYIALKDGVINDFKILLSDYNKCLIIARELNDYLQLRNDRNYENLKALADKMSKLKQNIEKLSELEPVQKYFENNSIRKFVEKHGEEAAKNSSPTRAKAARSPSSPSSPSPPSSLGSDDNDSEQQSELQKFAQVIEQKLLLDTIKEIASTSFAVVGASAAAESDAPAQLSKFLDDFDAKYKEQEDKLISEISKISASVDLESNEHYERAEIEGAETQARKQLLEENAQQVRRVRVVAKEENERALIGAAEVLARKQLLEDAQQVRRELILAEEENERALIGAAEVLARKQLLEDAQQVRRELILAEEENEREQIGATEALVRNQLLEQVRRELILAEDENERAQISAAEVIARDQLLANARHAIRAHILAEEEDPRAKNLSPAKESVTNPVISNNRFKNYNLHIIGGLVAITGVAMIAGSVIAFLCIPGLNLILLGAVFTAGAVAATTGVATLAVGIYKNSKISSRIEADDINQTRPRPE